MNLYDLLTNYNITAATRTFDEFYEYKSIIEAPYMVFTSTVKLTANLIAAVTINKNFDHVQFFDLWGNDTVQVIFSSDAGGYVFLFDVRKLNEENSGVSEFKTIADITDSDLAIAKITRENIEVLHKIYTELVEMLKKDEIIKKVVL